MNTIVLNIAAKDVARGDTLSHYNGAKVSEVERNYEDGLNNVVILAGDGNASLKLECNVDEIIKVYRDDSLENLIAIS